LPFLLSQATIGSTPPDSVAARWPLLASALIFAVSSGIFAVFRNLASGVIRKDYMATPESWSLLQSVYAVRDRDAASRCSILPLVRFIHTPLRRANPTVSTPGTQARHRSSATKPTNHVPPSWFLTTATVYSTSQVPGMLQPVTAMGFDAFQTSLSVCRARRPFKLGIARHPRIGGSHPPKNPARQ